MSLSDEEAKAFSEQLDLIERAKQGDQAALDALWKPIEESIKPDLLAWMQDDEQELEDILQQTQLYVQQTGIHRCTPRDAGRNWLSFIKECARRVLLAHAKQNDRKALDTLCKSMEQPIKGYIRVCTLCDEDEEKDILQETLKYFVQTGFDKFDPDKGRRLVPFVKESARWAMLRHYRARGQWGKLKKLAAKFGRRYHSIYQEPEAPDIVSQAIQVDNPDPETQVLDVEHQRLEEALHDKLFQLTFTHGTSPPHHLVAFGFARLLGLPNWPPRTIVAELSDKTLKSLETQLEDELLRSKHLPEPRLRNHMSDLRRQMDKTVCDILTQLGEKLPPWSVQVAHYHDSGVAFEKDKDLTDQECAVITERLQQCIVGQTTLRQHYTAVKPVDDLRIWCECVKRQVGRAIRREGSGEAFLRLERAKAREQEASARKKKGQDD